MGRFRERETAPPRFAEHQVRAILDGAGIKVSTDTFNDFLCFCPIHGNRNTPSLSVSKTKDRYVCFNADCGASGDMIDLVAKSTNRTYNEAARFVLQRQGKPPDAMEVLNQILTDTPDYQPFSQASLDRMFQAMTPDSAGRKYLHSRGFTDETIDYFRVGYSKNKNMVAVPVHSPDGNPIGVVGRSITSKQFNNSAGLPTSKILFNLHRAKKSGGTAILTEASFCAMAVHQAGFVGAVGNLQSAMSPTKLGMLDRYFDTIILFPDNPEIDPAGKALGMRIADVFASTKDVKWAQYDKREHYIDGLKDPTAIQEVFGEQPIKEMIHNAIPHWQFVSVMV